MEELTDFVQRMCFQKRASICSSRTQESLKHNWPRGYRQTVQLQKVHLKFSILNSCSFLNTPCCLGSYSCHGLEPYIPTTHLMPYQFSSTTAEPSFFRLTFTLTSLLPSFGDTLHAVLLKHQRRLLRACHVPQSPQITSSPASTSQSKLSVLFSQHT